MRQITRGAPRAHNIRVVVAVFGVAGLLLTASACAPSTPPRSSDGSAGSGSAASDSSAGSGTVSRPSTPPAAGLDLDADGSWRIACVLSPAAVNSILAPAGITVDSDEPGSSTDNADCNYTATNSAGASDFQLAAYGPTQGYGYLTPGTSAADWTAPNPAQGYVNACKAAQANGGAQCVPTIGRGLVVGDSYNQAVLFVDGPAFYSLNILYFAGRTADATTYIALAKAIAATGPVK